MVFAMDEMTANEVSIKTEKRRGVRFPVVVPVEAKWQEAGGKSVKEAAQAKEVNAQGGLLEMKVYPSVGSQLELTNLLSGEAFRARVLGTRRSTDNTMLGVAVELLIPSETFWGVNFRLKKTSAELVRLHHAMQSGNIDPRILREFRRAAQLNDSISADLAAHEVRSETAGMHEFFQAVERVYQHLKDHFKDRES